MILNHLFYETALILTASAALGGLALWLRQPLIVAFILVGILVGPSGLDLAGIDERLQLLAEIGITVLLFFFLLVIGSPEAISGFREHMGT